MIVNDGDLTEALARLSLEGGDNLDIEAKSFSEYSRKALGPTLSAFANLPGGGTILLGVAEDPVTLLGVADPHGMTQAVTSHARTGFSSPISVDPRVIVLDGRSIVAVNVNEAPPNAKPCSWKENGAAYLRQYDGDYRMSLQEEQQLLLRHQRPRNDSAPVPGTTRSDLDPELLSRFLRSVRAGSTALRSASDAEVLESLNVTTDDGVLTLGALYALGTYPQRHFPNLSITAAVLPEGDAERARDRLSITGPVPQMLTDAVEWATQVTSAKIIVGQDGHGRDTTEYPLVALRELIANALVHRDLSEPALSKSIDIRLLPDRLIISNPGGLWGLSVDQLGSRDGKSAVNEYLYTIAGFTSDQEGRRVIEGLGTGIRAVRSALAQADLEPVRFQDSGVRFTALLPRAALLSAADLHWLASLDSSGLSIEQRHALAEMRHGRTWTNSTYRRRFGLDSEQARRQLQELVSRGLITATGERRSTTYRLTDLPSPAGPGVSPAVSRPPAPSGSWPEVPESIRSLGRNTAPVWAALGQEPRSLTELTAATGLSRRQVSYALAPLMEAGLVEVNGGQGSRYTTYTRRA